MKFYYLFLFIFISCSTEQIEQKSEDDSRRAISGTEERDINEIIDQDFEDRAKLFKGNADREIESSDDMDQVPSEAITELKKEELDELTHVSGPITQAVRFCSVGNYQSGKKILDGIYSSYNKTPRFWNAHGVCEWKNGSNKRAKYFFDLAISIKKYAPSLNNLGVMHYQMGDFQKAFLLFKDASKIGGVNTPYYNLALLQFNFGLYDESINNLKEILRKNAKFDKLNILLASNFLRLNDIQESEKYFTLVNDKRKNSYLINFALLLFLKGDKANSINILNSLKGQSQAEVQLINNFLLEFKRG